MSPEARVLESIAFPASRVSSVAFGGPNLDTLYVTTAGGQVDDDGPEGTLYRLAVTVPGTVEFRSRIQI